MGDETNRVSLYSRRDFGKIALATLPAVGVFSGATAAFARQAKPNSVWGGVPFGIFAPYRFGPEASNLDGALSALIKLGVSQTELSGGVVENYLGAPQPAARGGGAGRAAQTPEQQAAARARAEALTAWRTSVPMSKIVEVRKKFADA